MLILRKRSIYLRASSTEVLNTLKKAAQKPALFSSFTEDSFSFTMWERHEYGKMFGAVRFIGTIEEQSDKCFIRYSIRPGVVGLAGLVVFLSVFLYSVVLLLFSTVSLMFLALSTIFPIIMILNFISQETTCDERLIGKLHELEKDIIS